jgi:hypothetical protein
MSNRVNRQRVSIKFCILHLESVQSFRAVALIPFVLMQLFAFIAQHDRFIWRKAQVLS